MTFDIFFFQFSVDIKKRVTSLPSLFTHQLKNNILSLHTATKNTNIRQVGEQMPQIHFWKALEWDGEPDGDMAQPEHDAGVSALSTIKI